MRVRLTLVFIAAALLVLGAWAPAHADKPTIGKPCIQCHKGAPDTVRGTLGARSEKFSTINVEVGNLVWVVKYDDATTVTGADSIAAIPKGKEIAVEFTGDTKTARAISISVKQPYTVPEEQKATLPYMKEMVAKGHEAGGYLLIDARPAPAYLEGHIPGAVSLPYADFDRMHSSVLPEDKDKLLIFYCGGDT